MIKAIQGYFKRNYVDSFRGLPKEVWYLSINVLINKSGMMVIPFMAIYLTSQMGWSESEAGFAIMFFGLGSVASALVGGWLSDNIGPYRTILCSNVFGGIGFIIMAYVESYYGLCLWIFLTSMASDAARPAAFTAITDFTSEENLTRGVSLMRIAINLGIAIGPAVGGFMAAGYGYHWLFLLDGLTCIAAGIVLLALFRSRFGTFEKVVQEIKGSSPYRDMPFMVFFICNVAILTVFFQIMYAVPLYFKDVLGMSETEIGLFFTLNGLMIFFCEMPIVFHHEKKRKYFNSLILGAIIIALAHIGLMLPVSPWWIVIAYLIPNAIGEIINFPFVNTIAVLRSDDSNKGKYMGAVTLLFSLAFVFAPITGLPLLEYISYNQLWMGCMVVIFIACGVLWVLKDRFAMD